MANTNSINLIRASSQYLTNTSTTILADNVSSATVELWIKVTAQPATDTSNRAFALVTSASGNNGFLATLRYVDVAGVKTVKGYFGGSGATWASVNKTLTTGQWYHISIVKDGTNVTLYIDAVSNATGVSGTAQDFGATSSGLTIGAGRTQDNYWDGLIDEVRIWNIALTQTEISNNKDTELTGSETGLVAYYKLNGDLLDATANNNDLTNNNAATFSTDVPFTGTQTLSVSETLNLSEILQKQVGVNFSETINLSEATSFFRKYVLKISETLHLTDVLSLLNVYFLNLTETLNLLDSKNAWSVGGALATTRYGLAGAGTQTAGLSFGGFNTDYLATTEEYDGTAWSAGGNLATAKYLLAGAGTQTAGFSFGGCHGNYLSTNE